MHDARLAAVDAARVASAEVREANLPARIRQRDLPVVHVTGEYEVEAAWLEPVDNPREVRKQDAQVGVARKRVRVDAHPAAHDQPRMHTGDPHAAAAQLEHDAL